MFAVSVDGPFCVLLCIITIENDIVYILTVRENVIIRYVKVMRIFHLFSLRFMRIQYIFSYNVCVRAYSNFPHGIYSDVDKLFHLIPI